MTEDDNFQVTDILNFSNNEEDRPRRVIRVSGESRPIKFTKKTFEVFKKRITAIRREDRVAYDIDKYNEKFEKMINTLDSAVNGESLNELRTARKVKRIMKDLDDLHARIVVMEHKLQKAECVGNTRAISVKPRMLGNIMTFAKVAKDYIIKDRQLYESDRIRAMSELNKASKDIVKAIKNEDYQVARVLADRYNRYGENNNPETQNTEHIDDPELDPENQQTDSEPTNTAPVNAGPVAPTQTNDNPLPGYSYVNNTDEPVEVDLGVTDSTTVDSTSEPTNNQREFEDVYSYGNPQEITESRRTAFQQFLDSINAQKTESATTTTTEPTTDTNSAAYDEGLQAGATFAQSLINGEETKDEDKGFFDNKTDEEKKSLIDSIIDSVPTAEPETTISDEMTNVEEEYNAAISDSESKPIKVTEEEKEEPVTTIQKEDVNGLSLSDITDKSNNERKIQEELLRQLEESKARQKAYETELANRNHMAVSMFHGEEFADDKDTFNFQMAMDNMRDKAANESREKRQQQIESLKEAKEILEGLKADTASLDESITTLEDPLGVKAEGKTKK